MKRLSLALGGGILALGSALAVAQDAPESLLPPGFDKPAAKPKPAPSAAPVTVTRGSAAPEAISSPVIQAIPGSATPAAPAAANGKKLPSLRELEAMSPEELDELLGLKPKTDIPPAARRSLRQVGVIDASEGGFRPGIVARQHPSLVRAVLEGNKGNLVSRWGHILLRRALASRLDAPGGISPADFAAMRAALLVRMGEGEAARAVVQDVDPGNYTPKLTQAALDAYAMTADITGICPVIAIQGGARKDPDWQVLRALCGAFQGNGPAAMAQLDRLEGGKVWTRIDMKLAEKYAGAAGKARRAVKIEWDGVNELTPWRYALTIGVGLEPPEGLMRNAPARYSYAAATAPMLPLTSRAAAADQAGARGVLSSAAMVDLYGQIYARDDITGPWQDRAGLLRTAYVGATPAERLSAIKQLWGDATDPPQRYSRSVLTAYAAARMPASQTLSGDAADLVASMLAAGLDQNAMRWASQVESGSLAWGMLALAAPSLASPVNGSDVSDFAGNDPSDGGRKTRFLYAGLAGLGRLDEASVQDLAGKLEVNLGRQTRWTRMIEAAADANNPGLVALLAGLGMQGDGWDKMTSLHLFHIVRALNQVGLGAEARMIAAEAVARG